MVLHVELTSESMLMLPLTLTLMVIVELILDSTAMLIKCWLMILV